MVFRTFLDKCNTIVKNSKDNHGLRPTCELNYGLTLSRILMHFDVEHLRSMFLDRKFPDITKLKHTLKLYNCGSLDEKRFGEYVPSTDENGIKKRATSFDVVLFKIPCDWDNGIGFDNDDDIFLTGDECVSQMGSNWYNAKSEVEWHNEDASVLSGFTEDIYYTLSGLCKNTWYKALTSGVTCGSTLVGDGIYSHSTLEREYESFKVSGMSDCIITDFHFEFGNENPSIDITTYVNDLITGVAPNYGIGIAFAPDYELTESDYTQYVGFFTDKTNTFYHPCLETRYDDAIMDNRHTFKLDKNSRLYLYSIIDGEYTNLDEIPTCIVGESAYTANQFTTGIYYADVKLSSKDYDPDMIIEDIWSGLTFSGESIDDVILEFETTNSAIRIGSKGNKDSNFTVQINGIKADEKLSRGDIREMTLLLKKPYTHSFIDLVEKAYYRVYAMDGTKEIDVIEWDGIDVMADVNKFTIDTNMLIPNKYRIDIKVKDKIFKDELRFQVVNNFTNKRI